MKSLIDEATAANVETETALRVGIVGGGVIGLAHAWSAAERGHQVMLFERDRVSSGASIRNFGMVWPVGQPPGDALQMALQSRARWLRLAQEAGVWMQPCGAMHLAHRDDEWQVLQEFAQDAHELGYDVELLGPDDVLQKTPAARREGLRGGLFSRTEVGVNPRQALPAIARFLEHQQQVEIRWETTVVDVAEGKAAGAPVQVMLHTGETLTFDRLLVCGGADLETLFPDKLRGCGLKRCKLQMLQTQPQPGGFRIGTHLASGLTLRHYHSFSRCPSLLDLKTRVAAETPELDRFGIHVMASQIENGEVILGDSHEYDEAITPFDAAEIDELILRELKQIIELPDWSIKHRWHGIYVKHPEQPFVHLQPLPHVHLVTGLSGAGMTLSFGIAEHIWSERLARS